MFVLQPALLTLNLFNQRAADAADADAGVLYLVDDDKLLPASGLLADGPVDLGHSGRCSPDPRAGKATRYPA